MKRPFPASLVALLVAGLLLLPACDSGSSEGSGNARLQLNARTTSSAGGGPDSTMVVEGDTIAIVGPGAYRDSLTLVKVEGLEGRIRLRDGYFITGSAGQGVEGEIDQDGRTIRVSLEAGSGGVIDVPGFYAYDGWVTNLEAGAYRLVVQHEGEYAQEEGDRLTVFDGEVQVK